MEQKLEVARIQWMDRGICIHFIQGCIDLMFQGFDYDHITAISSCVLCLWSSLPGLLQCSAPVSVLCEQDEMSVFVAPSISIMRPLSFSAFPRSRHQDMMDKCLANITTSRLASKHCKCIQGIRYLFYTRNTITSLESFILSLSLQQTSGVGPLKMGSHPLY